MALRLTKPHWKIGEWGGDHPPFIFADDYTGDLTALNRGQGMTFRLKPGTTMAQAEELKNLMADLIEEVGEQD